MNPALKTLPAVADDLLVQMRQQLARKDQALQAAEAIIQELREALRLERIKRFGKQSEKLSDLQLELLVGEPGVSSEEIAGEVERGPLPEQPADDAESTSPTTQNSSRSQRVASASEARGKDHSLRA
jgi:hypothetical protein